MCKEEIRQRRGQWAAQRDNEDEPMETDDAQTKTLYWTKDTYWTTGLKPRSSVLVETKKTPGQNRLGSLFSQFFSH